ncbi:DUF6438 domain-containing protein [Tenacibaculum sp. SSH1-16]|uniref:DUF6438 domain-containing protein n=1 Tax=Tenacibaculum sp. SSH1-16 TaxID=3136667 RepID=UPI0012E4A79B|nr:hypothetical protein BACY1_01160 [Tenacibaculum mesophilum]GFD75396.1 hypothetical protein KUL113_48160 [Tenacibaculum sp. KUL113]GFD96331.1 hypothetical protein KUL154_50640 [Alteromonas sp. KUL154]GFE00020.1 hypothetical protein KUL156_26120 [Alteromonas sp. KUL156]
MKYLLYSFLALGISCGIPKKGSETKLTEPTEKVIIAKEEATKPMASQNQLIVVLKNAKSIDDVKSLIKNSGLTWSKMAYETDASKIGIVEVPEGKRDFWIDKLQESGEFRLIDANTDEKLTNIISEEKNNLLRITKTQCFGDCPVYTVSIDKEGNVVYNGVEYVLVKGIQKFTLSEKQLQELNEKLTKKDFKSFKDAYNNPRIPDLSSTYIVHDGKQILIRLWKDIPDELIDIHEYIDGILLDKKFIE